MSSPKRFDIRDDDDFFVGERKVIVIDLEDAAGDPYNATGKTLQWVMRAGWNGDVQITKTTGGGGITLANGAGTNDRALIVVERADTYDAEDAVVLVNPGDYSHALKQTDSDDEAVLSYGAVKLKGGPTR